jgi:hypothetical protein
LRWVVIAREVFSRFGVLLDLPPLFLVDMFHAIGGRIGS